MAIQPLAVANPRLQLGAFEEFVKLVSSRSSGGPYLVSLRDTLDPFLMSPTTHRHHVDAVLAIYSAAWFGARVPSMQRMLRKIVRGREQLFPDLLATSKSAAVRELLVELREFLVDPLSDVYEEPARFRRALDVFMLNPGRDSRHVDRIVDSYAASFLASQLLFARPLLSRLMSKASRDGAADLASLTRELRTRASGRRPVAVTAGFLPVEPLGRRESDSERFRRVAVGLWVHIDPDDGYPLETADLQVVFQDGAQVYTATASTLRDGGEAEVTVETEMSRAVSRGRSLTGGVKVGVPIGPLQPSAGFDIKRDRRTEQTEKETVNEDHSHIVLIAVPLEETVQLNLRVPDRFRDPPGGGGLPLGLTLLLEVRLPSTETTLVTKLLCALRVGSLDCGSEHVETLSLPDAVLPGLAREALGDQPFQDST